MTPEELRTAHKHCGHNKDEIAKSNECGCFYCLATFHADEIKYWVDKDGQTAVCPRCSIDSVIGDASGITINAEFLGEMHRHYFTKH